MAGNSLMWNPLENRPLSNFVIGNVCATCRPRGIGPRQFYWQCCWQCCWSKRKGVQYDYSVGSYGGQVEVGGGLRSRDTFLKMFLRIPESLTRYAYAFQRWRSDYLIVKHIEMEPSENGTLFLCNVGFIYSIIQIWRDDKTDYTDYAQIT